MVFYFLPRLPHAFKNTVLKTVSATCKPVNISSISHSFYTFNVFNFGCSEVSAKCFNLRLLCPEDNCRLLCPEDRPHFWGYFEILSSRVFLVFFLCYRPLKYTHIKILSDNLLIYKYKYIYGYDAILKNKTLLSMDFGWSSILLNMTCILNSMHF